MTDTSTEVLHRTAVALRNARLSLKKLQDSRSEPIAVVGAGCRLPGAVNSLDEFAAFLLSGGTGIAELPHARWDIDEYFDPNPGNLGTMHVRKAGVLNDIAGFDAAFFGISPREASIMDPQHRILLEVVWEALEDAGIPAEELGGSRTGVFIGICAGDYACTATDPEAIGIYSATANASSVAAGRISYFLNLHGPSLVVDTACSSSLVAVHLAMQSLRDGECDRAIVGGVSAISTPRHMIEMSKLNALSPDARCTPFGADANGYVRGEGCGVLVLERSSQADPQRVLAHLVASAVTQDGASNGLTAPNGRAQEQVLREALNRAGLRGNDIDYLEAHGTGTPLGDPIEMVAVNNVLGAERDRPLVVGSVKANIGHLEAAAGIAGLLKAITVVRYRQLPPTPGIGELNKFVDWESMDVDVITARRALPQVGAVRAAVNAFGFSGTNAHVIVAAVENPKPKVNDLSRWLVLGLSAKTTTALTELARRYRERLAVATDDACRDICFSAVTGRTAHAERAMLIAQNRGALERGLVALADGRQRAGVLVGRRAHGRGRTAFVFSGHGGQWAGMGQQLMSDSQTFRRAVVRCGDAMANLLEVDIAEALESGADYSQRIDVEIPMSFAVQVGVAAVLHEHGVTAESVVGHSMGELAAAHYCGALTLEQAARIICERSRILHQVRGNGGLLAVPADADTVRRWILERGYELDIAAANGPSRTVVTGEPACLDRLATDLVSQGLETQRVRVQSAAHSRQLDPHLGAFAARIGGIVASGGNGTAFCSAVEGRIIDATSLDANYWVRNLRQPVLFAAAVSCLLDRGVDSFIEIGPSPVLLDTLAELTAAKPDRPTLVTAVFRRNGDPGRDLLELFARLHIHGIPFDVNAFGQSGNVVRLPTYPWEHKNFWQHSDWDTHRPDQVTGALTESSISGEIVYDTTVDTVRHPWLLDHAVGDTAVTAGAWLVNHVAALWSSRTDKFPCVLENFTFERPLLLQPDMRRRLQVVADSKGFQITADGVGAPNQAATNWIRHAAGQFSDAVGATRVAIDLSEITSRCDHEIDIEEFYRTCANRGLQYRSAFRTITALHRGPAEAFARVSLVHPPSRTRADLAPAPMLDGCFQAIGALVDEQQGLCLPRSIGRLEMWAPFGPEVWVHVHRFRFDGDRQLADLDIYDPSGQLLVAITDFTAERVDQQDQSRADDVGTFAVEWIEQSPPSAKAPNGAVLFVGSDADTARGALNALAEGITGHAIAAEELTASHAAKAAAVVFVAGGVGDIAEAAGDFSEVRALLSLAQMLISGESPPRLYIATVNAQAVMGEKVDPFHAMLWGFGTALAAEHPELRTTLIDRHEAAQCESISAEVLLEPEERHVCWRAERRFVARMRRVDLLAARHKVHDPQSAFRLAIDSPGQLDTLVFRESARPAPLPNQVVVRVHSAAMNFADVMRAMGFFLEPTLATVALGSECAGRVVAVGAGITDLQVGDRVACVAPGCFATYAVAPREFVFPLPDALSDAVAAAAPVAYTTASYALEHLVRPRQGQRILIHSASGGTGLASIAISQLMGLEILATAGSPAKRQFLRDMGIEHVMDSRSTRFVDEVLGLTDGYGVDIVLNSLSGSTMEANFRALAADGTLLELGKRDIYDDTRLPLSHFKRRISYRAVDMAGLQVDRPQVFARLFTDVLDRLMRGELPPLPVASYPIAEAGPVFRTMSAGSHTGKLALSMEATDQLEVIADPVARFARAGCHIISGGFGGLGVELATWLAAQGVTEIALMGRTAPGPATRERIEALRVHGVQVHSVFADVADKDQVAIALDELRTGGSVIRGVFHLAGSLRDGLVATHEWRAFREALPAKVLGAWNLHQLTSDDPLDLFVLYSSAASLLPSGGQANYAAANAFLDGLAHHRRAAGRPATTVSWGPFGDVGMAANAATAAHLGGRGITAISPAISHDTLARALAAERAHTAALVLDERRWVSAHPYARAVPLYSDFGEGDDDAGPTVDLRGLPTEERAQVVRQVVLEYVAATLGLEVDEVPTDVAFIDLGLGSLALVEFRNALAARLNIAMPSAVQWKYPTVDAVVQYAMGIFDTLAPEGIS